jgi:ankyrin repeat protein
MIESYGEGIKVKSIIGEKLPIHLAIENKAYDTAILLLKAYPEGTKAQKMDGGLPLHAACEARATDMAKALLELYPEGAKVQKKNGNLPLHSTCKKRDTDMTKALLEVYPEGAKFQNTYGCLPLHYACAEKLTDIALLLLELYPDGAKVPKNDGSLLLHDPSSSEVTAALLKAYPDGAKVQDKDGNLPLHFAVSNTRRCPEIVRMILIEFPEGIKVRNHSGKLPIHCALKDHFFTIGLLNILLLPYPECIHVPDGAGNLPSDVMRRSILRGGMFGWFGDCEDYVEEDYDSFEENMGTLKEDEDSFEEFIFLQHAIGTGASKNLFKLFLQAFPEACLQRDRYGMLPLHHACASRAPNFHEYVTELLDIKCYQDKQLCAKDKQGRTSFQLLHANDLFLVHHLAANSIHLSERVVRLLVDTFPKCITTPNKYGMLPFHCACLNAAISIEILMVFISLSPQVLTPIQPRAKSLTVELCGKRKRL